MISVIFTFLCVLYITRWFFKNKQLPPGPYGLPLAGYLPFLEKNLEIACYKLQRKYGDIFSFTVGSRLIVVLGSWDSIKQAFVKQNDIFSGRPSCNILGEFFNYNNLEFSEGESFSIQKRFMLRALRDHGFGKLSLEGKIHEEAQAMINLFNETNGKPMDVQVPFNIMTTNVICSIAFGERFEYNDKRMKKIIDCFAKSLIIFGEASLVEAFPILRYLPDKWNGLSNMRKMKNEMSMFVEELLDEHIRTFDKNNLRDLTDHYLNKMNEIGINTSDRESRAIFSRKNVIENLLLAFFAGTETTASILSWAVQLLLNFPEIQEKIQKEIDTVIGRSRLPSWADRDQLPYTEATIKEIHRIASLVPLSVVHSNTGDFPCFRRNYGDNEIPTLYPGSIPDWKRQWSKLSWSNGSLKKLFKWILIAIKALEEAYVNGYRIPKRTTVMPNLLSVHYDPNLWKNPEKFDPTRFLDNIGKVIKPEYLIPFSVGKRTCLGEPLANMEVFIFFVSFLQNFTFRCVGKPPDFTQVISGLLRKPLPFEVIVEPRI